MARPTLDIRGLKNFDEAAEWAQAQVGKNSQAASQALESSGLCENETVGVACQEKPTQENIQAAAKELWEKQMTEAQKGEFGSFDEYLEYAVDAENTFQRMAQQAIPKIFQDLKKIQTELLRWDEDQNGFIEFEDLFNDSLDVHQLSAEQKQAELAKLQRALPRLEALSTRLKTTLRKLEEAAARVADRAIHDVALAHTDEARKEMAEQLANYNPLIGMTLRILGPKFDLERARGFAEDLASVEGHIQQQIAFLEGKGRGPVGPISGALKDRFMASLKDYVDTPNFQFTYGIVDAPRYAPRGFSTIYQFTQNYHGNINKKGAFHLASLLIYAGAPFPINLLGNVTLKVNDLD